VTQEANESEGAPRDTPLSPHEIERINREHLVFTPLKPADLLFVFGTRHGVDEFIAAIAELWRLGYFRFAIVTGGATLGDQETEATVLARRMVAVGVPEAAILTEHAATNTGENVIFSLPLLDDRIGLANIRSLIAVGKLCTSRRYLMTLQRHWPEVEKMLVPVNWFGVPREDWHLHDHSRRRVLSEYRKIEPYKAAGFIAEWPADADA
jgi:uncharacterized SAM-binding protein YcdF (DUF218 family)